MVNQEIQTASISEKIGFSIVALPAKLISDFIFSSFLLNNIFFLSLGYSILAFEVNNFELGHGVHTPVKYLKVFSSIFHDSCHRLFLLFF